MHSSVLGFQLYITRLTDDYKDQWKATFVALARDIHTATSVHNITPALGDELLLVHCQLFTAAHFAIIYLLFDHDEYSNLADTHHSPPTILIKAPSVTHDRITSNISWIGRHWNQDFHDQLYSAGIYLPIILSKHLSEELGKIAQVASL